MLEISFKLNHVKIVYKKRIDNAIGIKDKTKLVFRFWLLDDFILTLFDNIIPTIPEIIEHIYRDQLILLDEYRFSNTLLSDNRNKKLLKIENIHAEIE